MKKKERRSFDEIVEELAEVVPGLMWVLLNRFIRRRIKEATRRLIAHRYSRFDIDPQQIDLSAQVDTVLDRVMSRKPVVRFVKNTLCSFT